MSFRKNKKSATRIAMIGQKHVPSREGGVEIVVWELARRLRDRGYSVECYNRSGYHSYVQEQQAERNCLLHACDDPRPVRAL